MVQREEGREQQRNVNQSTNTFMKGMDKDTDLSILAKDAYIHAQNFRLMTSHGTSSMALENIEGNLEVFNSFTTPIQILTNGNIIDSESFSNYSIVGYTNVRETLVLFLTNNVLSAIATATVTQGTFSNMQIVYWDYNSQDGSRLNFSTTNPISAIGRYESAILQKVYWVDGVNVFRFINIADPTIWNFPVNRFNILPVFNLTAPVFTEFITGSLQSGKIQYAYQVYQRYGGESLFSTCSPLISLTTTGNANGTTQNFFGDPINTNTGKGIALNITLPSGNNFTSIRVVSILYTQLNAPPTINIVAEQSIAPNTSNVNIFDFGSTYLGSYTFEQFSVISTYLFSAKVLETKNNYLFAGNITEIDWDVTFDARAYRFAGSENGNVTLHGVSQLYNNQGGYDLVSYVTYNGTPGYYITAGASFKGIPIPVPSDHDAINPYNNTANDANSSALFRYTKDSTQLGGNGPNVSFSFTNSTSKFTLDQTVNGGILSNPYTDYSNPVIETTLVGYQRDEIYRFGIIFLNAIGQSSTVKWIADVRFPTIYDSNFISPNITGSVGSTYLGSGKSATLINGITAFPLGINFIINTTGLYAQGAVSYQIVRVKRTSIDRTIMAQGITLPLNYNTSFSPARYTLQPFIGYTSSGTTQPYPATTNPDFNKLEFDSPEVTINKDLIYVNGDRLDIVGVLNNGVLWDTQNNEAVSISKPLANVNSYVSLFLKYVYKYFSLTPVSTLANYYNSTFPNTKTQISENGTYMIPHTIDASYFALGGVSNGTNLTPFSNYTFYNVVDNTSQNGGPTHYAQASGSTKAVIVTTIPIVSGDNGVSTGVSITGLLDPVEFLTVNSWTLLGTPNNWGINNQTYGGPVPNLLLCNYRRMNGTSGISATSQYSGNTYNSRQNNVYIACSPVYSITDNTLITVYGGDTYIGMFDYQRTFVESKAGTPVIQSQQWDVTSVYFPVETTINLDYRIDQSMSKIANNPNSILINESSGLYTFNQTISGSVYSYDLTESYGLYTYNSVYSQENTTISYFPPNQNVINVSQTFDTRILASSKKINGELYDNWVNFNINNFIDVDSTYGSLNNMIQFNDLLLFWQDKAFGNLSVNPRSIISDNNPGQIVLGTGGVLDRFDYISTLIGNPGGTAPIHGQNGVYWLDTLGKTLYLFHGQDSYFSRGTPLPFSKLKGLSAFLNDNVTNGTIWLGTYDYKYNEVIFSITTPVNGVNYSNYTFGYNELSNCFSSFYSYQPSLYINTYSKDYFTTSNNIAGLSLWLHNYGNRANFYGTVYSSYVTFAVNDNYASTKVFDNLMYNTSSTSVGYLIGDPASYSNYQDTFTQFLVYNTKQSTGFVNITLAQTTPYVPNLMIGTTAIDMSTNTAKRENNFVTNIGRNNITNSIGTPYPDVDVISTSTYDTTRLFRERMRDKFAIITMVYGNNAANNIFSVPYVITTYRRSYR